MEFDLLPRRLTGFLQKHPYTRVCWKKLLEELPSDPSVLRGHRENAILLSEVSMEYQTNRWWENYLVRYLMPSIAGVVICGSSRREQI